MERAHWKLLMYKLKEHEKIGDNLDLLISKLRQKQLLRSDVLGSTVSETVEKLVADLNASFRSFSHDSFVADFLEVLRSIPAFEDLAEQCTTNSEFAGSIKPEQATALASGKSGLKLRSSSADLTREQKAKLSSQYYIDVDVTNSKLRSLYEGFIGKLTDKCDSLQKEAEIQKCAKEVQNIQLMNEPVNLDLNTSELRAERAERAKHAEQLAEQRAKHAEQLAEQRAKHAEQLAEQRAKHAEQLAEHAKQQLAQEKERFEIERLELKKEIHKRQEEIRQLNVQKQLWSNEELQEVNKKMDNLQNRVDQLEQGVQEKVGKLQTRMNRLEQEREESCSPGRLPCI